MTWSGKPSVLLVVTDAKIHGLRLREATMPRLELVAWPADNNSYINYRSITMYSVFDRDADRHIFWHTDRQECVFFMERQNG